MASTQVSGASVIEYPATYQVMSFTCVDSTVGNGISFGDILGLVTPRTVSGGITANGAIGAPFAGIAFADKAVGDGSTTISVALGGTWKMATVPASGSEGYIQAGDAVELSGNNLIRRISGSILYNYGVGQGKGTIIGKALTTITAGGQFCDVIVGGF